MKRKVSIPNDSCLFRKKIFSMGIIFITLIFIIHFPAVGQMKNKNAMTDQISKPDSCNGIIIHQEITFKVSPQRVYEALLSSKQFSDCTKKSFGNFTAMSAHIDSTVGGGFSVFDGHIIGRFLELLPNQRIVAAWRVIDWPAGSYSIARFEFKTRGSGTLLIFDHIGFPEGLKEHLSIGWQQHYWDALTKYFE
jgi:activator of HSP90 ATPase